MCVHTHTHMQGINKLQLCANDMIVYVGNPNEPCNVSLKLLKSLTK